MAEHLLGDLPEKLCVTRVKGVVGDASTENTGVFVPDRCLADVFEVPTADPVEEWGRREQHGRCGSLFDSLATFDRRLQAAGVFL